MPPCIATVTNANQFVVRADGSAPFNDTPSTTDDAYNKFFVFVYDNVGNAGEMQYIINYTGASAQLELNANLTFTPAANDEVIIMRFPLLNIDDMDDLVDGTIATFAAFDDYRNFVRDDNNFKPTVIQRENAVSIITGRKKDTIAIGTQNHSNLWFGYVDTGNLLNDSDLAFTGLHCERKYLDTPNNDNLLTLSAASSGDDLPSATYGILLSILYDDFQESPIFLAKGGNLSATQTQALNGSQRLDIAINWAILTTNTDMTLHHGSRRITAVRKYICTTDPTTFRPTSPFLFVEEIDFTTNFSSAITDNSEFQASKRFPSELVQGAFSQARISADLATVVAGKEVVASLVVGSTTDNEEKKNYLIYPAVNSANRVTPDIHSESNIKNMAEHEIYEIFNIQPLNDLLAVFGERKLVLLEGTEEVDNHERRGVNGFWSVVSKGEKLFWSNLDSMYELVQGGRPNEIGFPIRSDWQAISAANRKTSKAVYDNKFNTFIIHSPSGTTYIYDDVRKSWRTYVSTTTFEWFGVGVDGEILATDKTNIFHLFPDSGSTETLTGTVEWVLDFEDYASIKHIEIMYKLTGVITVKVFDLEKSDSYHIAEVKFFAKSDFDNESQKLSFRAKKIRLQLTIVPTAASNFDYEIDHITLHGTKNIQENQ